jgi:hypothetical protein
MAAAVERSVSVDIKTIELLAAILFVLIALVGGGFVVKEVTIPKVPGWARVVSALLGLLFLLLFFAPWEGGETGSYRYAWSGSDESRHGLVLTDLLATAPHDPPRLHDPLEVRFSLRNGTGATIKLAATFVVGRDPEGGNRDFGHSNEGRLVRPAERVETTGVILLDAPGVWTVGPSYDLGNETYPGEWHRFPVRAAPR